ncbi:MAG TPA: ATP synthase F0 subunit C [Patescibacteria group bacterium]|nr:ATP synthase F0 subunit C [Patescibacteria group bacterium]
MEVEAIKYLAAAAAVTLSGLGAAISEGWIASKAMEAMGRNPSAGKDMFTRLIVAMALVESIAIYGFVTTLIILFL